MTKKQLLKLSLVNPKPWLGKKFSKEHREKISKARKGFKMSDEQKLKIQKSRIGDKHPNWKGGVKLENQRFRVTREYREFLSGVLERDEHSCKLKSSECIGCLEIHHIYNCMDYPELRYILNNGITLCKKHHPRGRRNEENLIPKFISLIIKKI